MIPLFPPVLPPMTARFPHPMTFPHLDLMTFPPVALTFPHPMLFLP